MEEQAWSQLKKKYPSVKYEPDKFKYIQPEKERTYIPDFKTGKRKIYLEAKGKLDLDTRQKMVWLNKHNITYKPNFVRSKEEKSKFAHDRAILVDDSVGCVKPFLLTGGHGILHKNAADTVQELHELIRGLRGVYALKFGFVLF